MDESLILRDAVFAVDPDIAEVAPVMGAEGADEVGSISSSVLRKLLLLPTLE